MRSAFFVSLLIATVLAANDLSGQTRGEVSPADNAAVLAAERGIWEAIKLSDWNAFDKKISGMTYVNPTGIVVWASGMSEDLHGLVLKSYSWDNVRTTSVAPGVVLLTYKATADQTMNGSPTPSPVYMMSLWRKIAGRWVAVAHSETPAAGPR